MQVRLSIDVAASPERLFDLTQDYGRRLDWDPFLTAAELLGGATEAGVGVVARCRGRIGGVMDAEYVSSPASRVHNVGVLRRDRNALIRESTRCNKNMVSIAPFSVVVLAALVGAPTSDVHGDPVARRVAALISTIGENSDFLHPEFTPSVDKLVDIGLPSLQHGVLELLISDDSSRRIRGGAVLYWITSQRFGFRRGRGWPAESKPHWEALWKQNGDYSYDLPEAERVKSYELWKAWVDMTIKMEQN